MTHDVQLLGISNAIVDVLAHIDGAFLERIDAVRGSMTLIDETRAHEIYESMGPTTEMSGGSVANSVAGFATLGGTAAYIGRVRDDQFGEVFNHDMRTLGVDIRLERAAEGASTARSYVLIEEDGQRTMQTYLGACTELSLADINESTVRSPGIVLIEGYVYDIAEGPALAEKSIRMAKATGSQVALSLSDSFCVERHRGAFAAAIENGVDIVVADEDEVNALFQTDTFDATLDALEGRDNLFAMTRSARGSVIVHGDQRVIYPATAVDKVVDTTGAGDAWCAGFLYGWARQESLEECARLGTLCATEVIQRVGARIEPGILDRSG
jgi:sugar/nucleoside kinase (ribokinase family)